jgi:hypothetical protein
MHSLSFPKNAAPYQECEKATNSSHIHLKTVKCDQHCPMYFAFKPVINGGRETCWRHVVFGTATRLFHSSNETRVPRTNSAAKGFFLRIEQSLSYSRNSPHFIETRFSLQCSQSATLNPFLSQMIPFNISCYSFVIHFNNVV